MNWLRRLLRAALLPSSIWSDRLSWGGLASAWSGPTASGVAVTPESALSLSAYYAAVERIATDVGSLPLYLYRREGRSRREVADHPLVTLLSGSPDGETTPMRHRQALMGHVLGWGNGYCEITFDGDGYPASLRLLAPDAVAPMRRPQDKRLYYQTDSRTLPPRRTLHIAGFGYDGLKGYTKAHLARECVALGLVQERQNARMYAGARPGGVIELPYKLKDAKAVDDLRRSVDAKHSGDNAGGTMVLEQGAKFNPLSINPVDAQFVESRQFQVIEIARWFGIPPHKIGDYSQAGSAYRALEEANLDYVAAVLRPWCTAIEQEVNRKLLTESERAAGYFVEHDLDAFTRGNTDARVKRYQGLMGVGAITPNQVAVEENLETFDGGDTRFVASTLVSFDNAMRPRQQQQPQPQPPGGRVEGEGDGEGEREGPGDES